MFKVKPIKKSIPALAAAAFLLVIAIVNCSSFTFDGAVSLEAIIKFFSVFALFVIINLLDIKLPKIAKTIVGILFLITGPVLCFEMVRIIVGQPMYDPDIYFDNLIFYTVLHFAVFALTQSVRISLITTFSVSWLLHTANQIVLQLRGTPLVPTDLYAINTAMTVTTPDEWHFDIFILTGTAGLLLLISVAAKLKISFPNLWARMAAGAAAAVIAFLGASYILNIDHTAFSTSTFDTESTNNKNGVALNFYIGIRKMQFDKPEGYDPAELDEFLSQYEDEELENEDELPNIIVIMNESFADLSYLGKLKTDVKYMPYFNELIKSYPHGKVLVSVLGGGTCNTEFEYLTGLSMMYMPNNCYTYMQSIKHEIPSMASYLKEYGYEAIAMHPFYEICWKRNSVYSFMQFDDFISGEDMTTAKSKYVSATRWEKGFGDDVEYVRTLISDSFFYDRVIEQFENKKSKRAFIFGVTVQNHSGYEYEGEDFVNDVHITSPEGYYPRAEQYLSLVKKSDEALKELIEYFEKVDEKTIIVFFGDHQPNVEVPLIDKIAPYRTLIVNSFLTRYETPFVIWANYDIGGRKDLGIISANFLGLKTLEYAGVPLSREYQMIKDVSQIAPAMNTWGYFDRPITWNERKEVYSEKNNILNIYNYYTYRTLTEKPEDTR